MCQCAKAFAVWPAHTAASARWSPSATRQTQLLLIGSPFCLSVCRPCSWAGAVWALVQLRAPNTVLLGVISRELLKPTPWLWDTQAFKVNTWHTPATADAAGSGSQQQQQQQQQRRLVRHVFGSRGARDAAEVFSSRYSGDAGAWGSLARPMPRSLMMQQEEHMPHSPDSSSSSGRALKRHVLQRVVTLQRPGATPSSSSSSSSRSWAGSLSPGPALGNVSVGYVHSQRLLEAHPRVRQLDAADVAKMASSCCLAGWAPPQLFSGESGTGCLVGWEHWSGDLYC
jgi:hypothetical protein